VLDALVAALGKAEPKSAVPESVSQGLNRDTVKTIQTGSDKLMQSLTALRDHLKQVDELKKQSDSGLASVRATVKEWGLATLEAELKSRYQELQTAVATLGDAGKQADEDVKKALADVLELMNKNIPSAKEQHDQAVMRVDEARMDVALAEKLAADAKKDADKDGKDGDKTKDTDKDKKVGALQKLVADKKKALVDALQKLDTAHVNLTFLEEKLVRVTQEATVASAAQRADQLDLAAALAQVTAGYVLMNEKRQEIFEALAQLRAFEKAVAAADDPQAYDGNISYNSEIYQLIKLTVAEKESVPADYKGKTKHFKGTITFKVMPYSRLSVRPGVSAVYSFVKDPVFSTEEVTDDAGATHHMVKVDDSEYKEYAVSGMLQFVPQAWDNDDVAFSMDLGVTTDGDALGLLLGGTVSFFRNRAGLGLGIIGQRVDELGPGLSVGQMLDTADLLKTDKTFDTGMYLAVGIKVGK